MPNFISNGDDWFPLSDDPVFASQQVGALKKTFNTTTIAAMQTVLNNIDSKTGGKFLPAAAYKRKTETGS